MKPETLDPVIELRDAISLMLAAPERMALLDEEGRIAAINPPWREAARKDSPSTAAMGRGANLLDLCDEAAAQGERHSAELAAAIRRVLSRASTWASVPMTRSQKNGQSATSNITVRRVRGPLENWLLVAYSEARTDSAQPSPAHELAAVRPSELPHAPARTKAHTLTSQVTRPGAAA